MYVLTNQNKKHTGYGVFFVLIAALLKYLNLLCLLLFDLWEGDA